MLGQLIGEVFGTFILILLGDGVVANVGLAPRLAAPAYNWNTITFGWVFAVVIATASPLPARVTSWSVLVALALGGTVGVVFGVYPARRAARLDPNTALRAE